MSDSVTLWTVAQQAPLLMELSRQEYWSGLPGSPPGDLPNPGIEPTPPRSPVLAAAFFTSSASWKALSVSHSLQPTLCNPMDCYPPGFSVHGILQARIREWVAIPFSRRSSQPGIEPRSPALQADSYHLRHQEIYCYYLGALVVRAKIQGRRSNLQCSDYISVF